MRWSLPISIVAVVIVFAACLRLIFADQLSGSAPFQLESGDYLSSKYLEVLEKTRSPFAVHGGRALNLVVVQKVQDATEVLPIVNFHEGGPSFRVSPTGTVELKDTAGFNIGHYLVQIINGKDLAMGFDHFPPERFVFVKDLQGVICGKSVAGRYVDHEGRPYKF